MAVLHLVNKPAALAHCLEVRAEEDVVVLIEDAVYAAVDLPAGNIFLLDTDVHARGVAAAECGCDRGA